MTDGKYPATEDVLLLVQAALNSPFAKAAHAVIEAEPRYVVENKLVRKTAICVLRGEEWHAREDSNL